MLEKSIKASSPGPQAAGESSGTTAPAITLADRARTIRDCANNTIKTAIENAIKIGRELSEARDEIDHGDWLNWINIEFDWSDQTARNFINLYELSRNPDSKHVLNCGLPLRALYRLAAPKAAAARKEIAERVAEDETPPTVDEVEETLKRKKKGKIDNSFGAADTAGATETADAVNIENSGGDEEVEEDASTAEYRRQMAELAAKAEAETDASTSTFDQHDDGDRSDEHADCDKPQAAAAAVNQLDHAQLRSFFDQIRVEHQNALKQHFGCAKAEGVFAEIAELAAACTALLAHPKQHIADIHKKLARIRKLAGGKGEARSKAAAKSNSQLDRGAFARGMNHPGFPTMNMAPNGVDASGKTVYAPHGRAGRSRPH